MSGGSNSGRKRYKDQIHVQGQFGTRTFRRDDDPDYGVGDIECVVSFDGVVDFRDDAVIGCVSLSEEMKDEFIDSIDGRVQGYTIHTFEQEED